MRITDVGAEWILDSRGHPTVEVAIRLDDGSTHRASAPSGASTGRHEIGEARDGDPHVWRGLGVGRALEAVRGLIRPQLMGVSPVDQGEIDALLIEIDGTSDRSRLGSNGLVATSCAVARAGAHAAGCELWQHLAQSRPASLPLPMVNLLSGNKHAAGGMSIQDVLIVPIAAPDLESALQWVVEVYMATADVLGLRGLSAHVGDEGGFATTGLTSEQAIEVAVEAIERAGRVPGEEVQIALDVASGHFFDGVTYRLDGHDHDASTLIEMYLRWLTRYPICSIEDPFADDEWSSWTRLVDATVGLGTQILGDDLIVTNRSRLHRAVDERAANAVLVKANQIGTLTEALDVADRARQAGWRAVVSARSGETEDDWLADLAIAAGTGQIKVGSIARSERLSKYNRLLRLGRTTTLPYAGGHQRLPLGTQ